MRQGTKKEEGEAGNEKKRVRQGTKSKEGEAGNEK